jgi:predicted O-methyltransferase YrrM
MNTTRSPHIVKLLDRLFAEANASEQRRTPEQPADSSLVTSKSGYRKFYGMMKNMPLPVSRETGELLYMLTRATRATNVLEFGTSFGVSTIYLAAALRDNGGGQIITTEFEPSKVERARRHLAEAGLADLVEVREGDALDTLASDLPGAFDLVLLDGAKALYTDILRLVERHLRPGTLVLADDADYCPEYVKCLRSDARYVSIPMNEDLEISMLTA